MKILYTLNSGNPGGMEQHVLDLVDQMCLRGHEVYVWCNNGIIYDWYRRAGARVTEKTIKSDLDLKYINELKNFIRENGIQVVHAHEIKAVANTLIAGYLSGVKIRISHQHTPFVNWQVPRYKRLLYGLFYSWLVRFFGTREIALTESVRKIKTASGIPSGKIAVIPNGINTYKYYITDNEKEIYRREVCRKYHMDPSCKIIGNISRTTEEKGHDLLIKAFSALVAGPQEDRQKYVLLICGGGPLEESLWQLAGNLGIKDRVVITGRFEEDMKVKFYGSFDYFVFPSRGEGFGIVLIEALAAGLPVLSSDLTVLKEVGATYPHFFRDGDVDNLATALNELISRPSGEDRQEQKNFIEKNYSLGKFGDNYHNLYGSLHTL